MAQEQFEGEVTLARHLGGVVERRLQRLEKCLNFSASADPVGAVHDLRVASRRLRAFGVVFRDVIGAKAQARLEKKLRRVTKAAGAIRDRDVQNELVQRQIERAGSDLERGVLEYLLERLDVERSMAAAKAEKRLRKVDMAGLSSAVSGALQEVTTRLSTADLQHAHARQLLWQLVANAALHAPSSEGAEQPQQLHLLRIDVKELRYALELFEPVVGPLYAVLYERATAMQEILGTYQDLVVLGEVVQEMAAELERKRRRTLLAGMVLIEQALASERLEVLARFRGTGFELDWWRVNLSAALEGEAAYSVAR